MGKGNWVGECAPLNSLEHENGKATATPLPLGNVHECPHLQGLMESELESGGGFGEAGCGGGGGGGGMKQAGP